MMTKKLSFFFSLLCISGKYADVVLDEITSSKVPWSQWKQAHPNTKFMKP
ncbi:MAG: DUF3179 domain-containing protein [Calditrichaeota bacterium]|nr:DUF3179 domain-containing protein [Calditrichota bacterium]